MPTSFKIDIIILSNGKTEQLRDTTQQAIDTVLSSEDPNKVKFEILVIESDKSLKPFQYPNTTTIYPDEPFGYNKYLNIGINMTHNEYVCLCNNDLLFHKNWASEILKAMDLDPKLLSVNPYSENFDYNERIKNGPNVIYRNKTLDINGVLTGWCIFVKRSIFEKIGLFDEQFTFWYADNDYDLVLRRHNIKHALVKSSLVTHIACQSHDLLADMKQSTTVQSTIYIKKWQNTLRVWKVLKLFRFNK